MNDDKLYIGEVARLLGIASDTLRYFDKEGIVTAKKNANNYRYYDDWDINFLIEYKKYRSFGYNVQEAKEILYEDDLDQLTDKFIAKQNDLQKLISQYQLILDKSQRYTNHLCNIRRKIGQYIITDMIDVYYFPMRYNNTYLCKPDIADMMNEWMNYFPIVDPALVIEDSTNHDYECALSILANYQKQIHLPFNNLVKHTQKSKAINTIIVAGDKNTFSTDLLNPVYEYIKTHHYQINGPVIGYYLARVHEKDGYKRYIDLFVPIK